MEHLANRTIREMLWHLIDDVEDVARLLYVGDRDRRRAALHRRMLMVREILYKIERWESVSPVLMTRL